MFQRLRTFIQELDERGFYKYAVGFLIIITLGLGGIMYTSHYKIKNLQKRIKRVNTSRQNLQDILSTFEEVKQQKAEVAEILDKSKTFKIVGYIDQLIASLNLTRYKAGAITQSEESLDYLPEYSEIKAVIPFAQMNMVQLAELLHEIEKKERIYTKELDITKSRTGNTIDVTLTIATLQARAQTTE